MLVVSFGSTVKVRAHSLVADKQEDAGVILHIAPDDDPIVGELSTLFFDLSDQKINTRDYYFSLDVTSSSGFAFPVATEVEGNTVSGVYDFPDVGEYKIRLVATNRQSGEKFEFSKVQEVARVEELEGADNKAKILLGGAGVTASIAVIMMVFKRSKKTAKAK